MGALTRFNLRPLLPHGYNRLIETGSGRGWSIEYALKQGFSRVDSVDATPAMFEWCSEVFKHQPNVYLSQGFSSTFLSGIEDYKNSVVFLDAHFVGGPDFMLMSHEESAKHPDSFPVLNELDVLLKKDTSHTIIIIDDVRMWYEDAGTSGKVPAFAERYSELPELIKRLQKFETTHKITRVPMDEGYLLLLPKTLNNITPESVLTLDDINKKVRDHDINKNDWDMGLELIRSRNYKQALSYYKTQWQSTPNNVYWGQRYANVLFIMGNIEEALKVIRKVLILDPTNGDARWLEGHLYMVKGDLDNAWPRMESRMNSSHVAAFGIRPQTKPMWDGQKTDKMIYVWREQGYGDTIQMLRYLSLIDSPNFVVEVDNALMRLCKSSFPRVNFMFVGDDIPEHDYQVSLQSLPYLFKTNLQTIPKTVPYLKTGELLRNKWAENLEISELPPGPKIGLCWQGSSILSRDITRSIPFKLFAPIADDYTFVSLQYNEGIFQDFADTAACMSHLDLILSIDTSVAHLAGALGVPLWLMAAQGCDARWMLNREDSPWYPAMRIVRQKEPGNWEELISRIKVDLHRIIPPRIIPAERFVA
jgi:hypothetical protein